jgi:flavin reductase
MTPDGRNSGGEAAVGAISAQVFRDGMARLGAAVSIVTSDGPAGRVGFTATAVCSVSDKPPTLIVCINRLGSAYHPVVENRVLAVNVLAADQRALSELFGGKMPMDERFARDDWGSASCQGRGFVRLPDYRQC